MNHHRGFTILELIIVIAIMGILLTLGVVNLRGSQANGRDTERRVDVETIAQHLETFYTSGTDINENTDCSGGNNINHSNGYTIHTFTNSGTITCPGTISATVLIVGGGGSGPSGAANVGSGGGGAGGYLTGSETLTGSMPVVVGNGGTADNNNAQASSFGTRTAAGGGSGGGTGYNSGTGADGGSGGGSAGSNKFSGNASPSGQGSVGGLGFGTYGGTTTAGGGGGGSRTNGTAATSATNPGVGGSGTSNNITGSTVTYAAGGAGAPTSGSAGEIGTNNTGNGARGGAGNTMAGANGGSGIVIIRYLTSSGAGIYPSTAIASDVPSSVISALRDIDPKLITAPTISDPSITFVRASNNSQSTDNVLFDTATLTNQPITIDQYVYQPLQLLSDGSWALCTNSATQECRKFNLYYKLETDSTVKVITSKNQ